MDNGCDRYNPPQHAKTVYRNVGGKGTYVDSLLSQNEQKMEIYRKINPGSE